MHWTGTGSALNRRSPPQAAMRTLNITTPAPSGCIRMPLGADGVVPGHVAYYVPMGV